MLSLIEHSVSYALLGLRQREHHGVVVLVESVHTACIVSRHCLRDRARCNLQHTTSKLSIVSALQRIVW